MCLWKNILVFLIPETRNSEGYVKLCKLRRRSSSYELYLGRFGQMVWLWVPVAASEKRSCPEKRVGSSCGDVQLNSCNSPLLYVTTKPAPLYPRAGCAAALATGGGTGRAGQGHCPPGRVTAPSVLAAGTG